LGIAVTDYSAFERAFVSSLATAFDSPTALVWKKVFTEILEFVLPECVHQEALLVTQRPLRVSGGSTLRDASESEAVVYYAEYAFKLITSNGDEEEKDPSSVHRRLYTSLHNTIDDEYYSESVALSRCS
jgi:hypothetical protein